MKNQGNDLHCSGAILDPNHVITAAHCMKINGREVKSNELTIIFGASDLKDPKNAESGIQTLAMINYEIHPQYAGTAYFDVSIIRLNQKILFSESVWPICLPSKYSSDRNLLEKQQGIAVGFGPINPFSTNPNLTLTTLPLQILNSNVCNARY